MRFFRRIKKRTSDAHFLALDIGTDVIKALVCEAEGSKAKVLGVGTKKQKLGDMQSGVVTDIASVKTSSCLAGTTLSFCISTKLVFKIFFEILSILFILLF